MPLPLFFLLLSKKTLLLATGFATLDNRVFAQMTCLAAHSHNLSAPSELAIWYVVFLILGTTFCASIFWWRREKDKDDTSKLPSSNNKNKIKDSSARRLRSRKSPDMADQNDGEINANLTTWIQNNIDNKNATGYQQQELLNRQSNNSSVTRAQTASLFRIPDALAPIDPLPISSDESLLDAIEQIQDFDVTEDKRETAINVLLTFKSQNAVEALTQVAHYDESARLRIAALNGLGEFDHESVFEPVLLTCADPAREVRAAAARTFARLTLNRAEAYTRIVESEDPERLRLASMACVEAGMATHALARLAHYDNQQANDAFAMVRLLVAAGEFVPIIKAISDTQDVRLSLIMIKALRAIRPIRMLPALYYLTDNSTLSAELKTALYELVAEISAT